MRGVVKDRTHDTFLIFPGAHGELRRIHLCPSVLQIALGCVIAGVVAVGALANTYARMLLKVFNYYTVRIEYWTVKTLADT